MSSSKPVGQTTFLNTESTHAVLSSSVFDRMMEVVSYPYMNGHRAESLKNGKRVHPGAFIFSLIFLISLSITPVSEGSWKDSNHSSNSSIASQV